MNLLSYILRTFGCVLLLFVLGCGAPQNVVKDKPFTPARQKLVQICKDDYKLNIVTKALDNTLWIYLPGEEPFLVFKANDDKPQKNSKPAKQRSANYLDGWFENMTFKLQYDITINEKYTVDYGYSTKYTEQYNNNQRNLLTAISRAYTEIEKLPGTDNYVEKVPGDIDYAHPEKNFKHKKLVHSNVKTAPVPDFFVIVIADIKTGMELKIVVALSDLRRGMQDNTFSEEYNKRIITNYPTGHKGIIGDKAGGHLEYTDLTWPDFLAMQMVTRVRTHYQKNKNPVGKDDFDEDVLSVARAVIDAYKFEEFSFLELQNMDTAKSLLYSKEQLKDLGE